MTTIPPPHAPPPKRVVTFPVVAIAIVAVAGFGVLGVTPRLRQREALARAEVEANAPRRAVFARAGRAARGAAVTLPGTAEPLHATMLYAKTTGFVRSYLADIGDHVKAGQLLAQIDAPETAEELRLARARVEEAESNVGLYQTNADRNRKLSASGLIAPQQMDETDLRANTARAAVKSSRAEAARIGALTTYQRVVAPFEGTVTKRKVDRGMLVTAGQASMLFEVADTSRLRVFVDVPQSIAADVVRGLDAQVWSPSTPTKTVGGKVTRTAGALDASTRTLRVEIEIAGDGPVLAGAFVSVRFAFERSAPPVLVPASALVVKKEGTSVFRIGDGDVVTSVPVVLGRDLGKEVEIVTGVAEGDRVVLNVPDELATGQTVRPTERLAP